MGYRITYFQEDGKRRRSWGVPLTVLFLTLFLGWTFRSWEEGSAFILETLFPVSAAEAREAAGEMAEQIGAGEGVVQAFTEFYQTVFLREMEGVY